MIRRSLAPLVAFAWTALSSGAPAADFSRDAQLIAPYLSAHSIAVVGVDFSQLDLSPVADQISEIVPDAGEALAPTVERVHRIRAAVVDAGFDRAVAILNLRRIGHDSPLVVFPKNPGSDPARLETLLTAALAESRSKWTFEQREEVVLVALPGGMRDLATLRPVERPELAAAVAAAGDCVAVAALALGDDHRRAVDELLPVLPEEVGGVPSTHLTRGLRWAAAFVQGPPQPAVRVVVQSADEASASALLQMWTTGTQEVGKRLDSSQSPLYSAVVWLLTPKQQADRLVLAFDGADQASQTVKFFAPLIQRMNERSQRHASMVNLKQQMLALLNFESATGRLPAIGTYDAAGSPLLSWRVHVLPFLNVDGASELYHQFHLDEPWDSPHNKQLLSEMPEAFRCPASRHGAASGLATYREVVGEQTPWPWREGLQIKQITDGSSNTISLVEVDDDHAVPWTKPEGLPFDPNAPPAGLGGQFDGGFNAVFCDGHVQFIALPADADKIVPLLTRDGEETIQW